MLCVGLILGAPVGAASASHSGDKESSVRLPPEYTDEASERFWNYAEDVLGSRLGYSAESDQSSTSVTLAVGAVRMSARDRRRLRDAAPTWAKLNMFETRYSLETLNHFGRRAEAALRKAGLHDELWGGYSAAPFGHPDLVTILLAREDTEAREVLREELPDRAFTIDIGRIQPLGPRGEQPVPSQPWTLVLIVIGVTLPIVLIVRLGTARSSDRAPKPAH